MANTGCDADLDTTASEIADVLCRAAVASPSFTSIASLETSLARVFEFGHELVLRRPFSDAVRTRLQDACGTLATLHRGSTRWLALRALTRLGDCTKAQFRRLMKNLLRQDETPDVLVMRSLVSIMPVTSSDGEICAQFRRPPCGEEFDNRLSQSSAGFWASASEYLEHCAGISLMFLKAGAEAVLEGVHKDQVNEQVHVFSPLQADLALRLYKAGILNISNLPDENEELPMRLAYLVLRDLGFWWGQPLNLGSINAKHHSLPASLRPCDLLTALEVPISEDLAAICFGLLALHFTYYPSSQIHDSKSQSSVCTNRSASTSSFGASNQTALEMAINGSIKYFSLSALVGILSNVSVVHTDQHGSRERWVWPLLCLLNVLDSPKHGFVRDLAARLPECAGLPLHVQHWSSAARLIPARSWSEIHNFALKVQSRDCWFMGCSSQDAEMLSDEALRHGYFGLAAALELAFPATVVVSQTWRSALLRQTHVDICVEKFALLTALVWKNVLPEFEVKLDICHQVPWQLRTAQLNFAAALGADNAKSLSHIDLYRVLIYSTQHEEREAACACVLRCFPNVVGLQHAVLTNIHSPWCKQLCDNLKSNFASAQGHQQEGWFTFVGRFHHSSSNAHKFTTSPELCLVQQCSSAGNHSTCLLLRWQHND